MSNRLIDKNSRVAILRNGTKSSKIGTVPWLSGPRLWAPWRSHHRSFHTLSLAHWWAAGLPGPHHPPLAWVSHYLKANEMWINMAVTRQKPVGSKGAEALGLHPQLIRTAFISCTYLTNIFVCLFEQKLTKWTDTNRNKQINSFWKSLF